MLSTAAGATTWIAAAIAAFTLVVAVGSAFVVQSRTSGMSTSLDMMQTANNGLRSYVGDLERKLVVSEAECDRKLHEQEVSYTGQIHKLEGKVDILTSDLAQRLVTAAVEAATRKETP